MVSFFGFCFRLKKSKPKISKTSQVEKVGSIDDLLIQILVHLPSKPLFRFKSVSKHWNSIISDPKFQLMRNQLLHAHSNNRAAAGLIFQNNNYKDSGHTRRFAVSLDRPPSSSSNDSNPLPHVHNFPHTQTIFNSCNGLLVLKRAPNYPKFDYDYYVYNPSTNQKTTTPLLIDEIQAHPLDRVCGMYLAFDPSKSPHYKVVCVWMLGLKTIGISHMQLCRFDVYSSETGSWELGRVIDAPGHVDFDNGVYWNGAIHWLTQFGKSSMYFNPDHHHDDMPRVMPMPPVRNRSCSYFGESCDHLHYAVLGGDPQFPRGIHVYEMRRDYSGWFLKYEVEDYSQYLQKSVMVQQLFCVVRGERDDEEDSFLVLGTKEGHLFRYNLVRNTCQTMKVKAKKGNFDLNCRRTKLFPYIESPYSV